MQCNLGGRRISRELGDSSIARPSVLARVHNDNGQVIFGNVSAGNILSGVVVTAE